MAEEARRSPGVLAEINITPLIDVMLVLLIIFMLVAPVANRGLDVGLPQERREAEAPLPAPRPVVMTLEGGPGRLLVSLDKRPVDARELASSLRDLFQARSDKTMFVRAEGSVRYGQVVEAMDTARGAGVARIGIIGAGAER